MRAWIIAAIAAQALDAATTCRALTLPGAREGNPLLPSTCGRIVLTKAALTSGLLTTAVLLERRDHKTLGRFTLGVTFAAGATGAALNLRVIW